VEFLDILSRKTASSFGTPYGLPIVVATRVVLSESAPTTADTLSDPLTSHVSWLLDELEEVEGLANPSAGQTIISEYCILSSVLPTYDIAPPAIYNSVPKGVLPSSIDTVKSNLSDRNFTYVDVRLNSNITVLC
jgi:hypothetical protein